MVAEVAISELAARVVATRYSWFAMRTRCHYSNRREFSLYGGRGITVYPEWDNSFDRFVRDMGLRPEGTSLDRVDPDGNYEPSNCRWATPKEQANNKRNTIRITHNGECLTLSEWSLRTGLDTSKIRWRMLEWGDDTARVLAPIGSESRSCLNCGILFVTLNSSIKKFCGEHCRATHRSLLHYTHVTPPRPQICVICKTGYQPTRTWQKYCSRVCRDRRQNKM